MGQRKKLPPKEVRCACGNVLTLEEKSDWCTKCAHKVFYDVKDQRRYRLHNIYTIGMILSVITFLTYVFIELIAVPLLSL